MRRWKATLIVCCALVRVPALFCDTAPPRYITHPVPVSKQQEADPTFCFNCHADTNAKFVHGAISTANCTSCHTFRVQDGETQVILVGSGKELCLQCHANKDAEHAKGKMHQPVGDGCMSCHNPHASNFKDELVKATTSGVKDENLCSPCHQEGIKPTQKDGSRHAALEMGCGTCHVTHKTGAAGNKEFDFYLTKTSPALCLDCHYPNDPKMTKAHSNQPVESSDCTSCHDPHRSSVAKLLHPNGHDPYVKNQCEKCHATPKDGRVVMASGGNRALCYNCHDKKKAQVEESRYKHPVPFMTETCTDCHDPHASVYPNLLRTSQGAVCANCHEKSTLPVKHAPYEQGECAQCHDSHGSNEVHLLRAKGNTLCRACHVAGQNGVVLGEKTVLMPWNRKISMADYQAAPKLGLDANGETGHPVVGHPMTGVNTLATDKGALTCSTCHQAHASKAEDLMPDTATNSIQLCEQCHNKV